jgi:hypothetical protein
MVREDDLLIRELSKNPTSSTWTKFIKSFVPKNENCSCGFNSLSFSPIPSWMGTPKCSKCGTSDYKNSFYTTKEYVLVQIDNQEPVPLCDACISKIDNNTCEHILKEIERHVDDEDGIRWRGKIEWSPNNGENWYHVSGTNIIPYMPYVVESEYTFNKFKMLVEKLHTGNTVAFKGWYEKKPAKILHVNVSTI